MKRMHHVESVQFDFCWQSLYEMVAFIYLIPMMDDLRVLKGSFKNVNSTVDCENSLAMDSVLPTEKEKPDHWRALWRGGGR